MNHSRRTRDRRLRPRRPLRDELLRRSDEQLVELVLDGHDSAFDVLFDRHVADSLWYARELLGSWGDAEEAVRHSFAAAHAYLATRGRETEFWPWLQTILGNYCLSMLQARVPGPEQSAGDSTVVDLGEWRPRRKLFGVTLPCAPNSGLREAVMAVCGVGSGAAAAGAPLMGGTLAKVAIGAVLVGGAGVVGDEAYERMGPASGGIQVSAQQDPAGSSHVRDVEPVSESTRQVRGSPVAAVREPHRESGTTREQLLRRDDAPAAPGPGTPTPASPGVSAPAVQLTPAPTGATPVQGTDSVVQPVADVVESQEPPVGSSPQTPLPDSLDLSKIGDDLGVSALTPPVDVHALLSQGVTALPK